MNKQTVEQAAHFHIKYGKPKETNLTSAKYGAFIAGAAWQKEQGIEWISVDTKPPRDENEKGINCSINVLVWGEGHYIVEGVYFPDFNGWRCKGAGNWQPTHWAYFNTPKTDK